MWPLFLIDSNGYAFRMTVYDAEKAAIEIEKSGYPEAKVFAQVVRTIQTENGDDRKNGEGNQINFWEPSRFSNIRDQSDQTITRHSVFVFV